MKGRINPKILGSTLVGFALVAGAYTVSNFGEPRFAPQEANVASETRTQRVIIDIEDTDKDGVEDWRDDFVIAESVVLNTATSTYTPPETLTGQMSVSVLERAILSRGYGSIGTSDEEIIFDTVNNLEKETVQTLYGTKDIDIINDWDNSDIVNYGNTVASTIFRHNDPDTKGEIALLEDVARNGNQESLKELIDISKVYKNYLDDTLKTPVPGFMVKEHLDLINSYSAIYEDVSAMTKVLEDPILSLVRLKRYQDDATALGYSLQNIYYALDTSGATFSKEDPAQFFSFFDPDYQSN